MLENGADAVSDAGGIDTATSTISRSLAVGGLTAVENLTLVNVATALNGIGNNLNNVITGNNFNNTLSGGLGNDTLRGGLGNDTLDGGTGVDWADYRDKTSAVVVTLNGATNATVTVGGVNEDTIKNIEKVLGGTAADTLTGDTLSNTFRGGGGADILNGQGGVDTADYSDKTAAVSVTLNGSTNATVKVGGVNEDTIKNFEKSDRRDGRRHACLTCTVSSVFSAFRSR